MQEIINCIHNSMEVKLCKSAKVTQDEGVANQRIYNRSFDRGDVTICCNAGHAEVADGGCVGGAPANSSQLTASQLCSQTPSK